MINNYYDYFESFQMFIMLYVIIGMGYFFSWRKSFDLDDCYTILRLIRLVCYSSYMFREIAISEPNYFTWKPLIISALTFLSIRILLLIISIFYSRKELLLKYLQFSFSCSYVNFISFGYPFIKLFYGPEYEYICMIMNIVQCFIMRPIDIAMVHLLSPVNPNQYSSVTQTDTQLENLDNLQETEHQTTNDGIEEYLVSDSTPDSAKDTFIFHDNEPLIKPLLYSIISPQNVCTLLGIAYSFTKFGLPPIIDTVVSNFANMAVGTTLFFIGVSLWIHPWRGCNYLQVVPCLLVKHVVMPALALLFAWLLKFDALTSKCCVMLFSMPADYTGIALLSKSCLKPNPITFSFFFSQFLGLPLFFAWVAVLNEFNIFSS